MIVEAALTRDKNLAFQAILNDPLTSLPTDAAWKMFNEMLRATKAFLGCDALQPVRGFFAEKPEAARVSSTMPNTAPLI